MNILLIIILVVLILLIILIIYFGISKKNSEPINIDNIKETLQRIEADLKNEFGVLTEDQKTSIAKWTSALDKLGTTDNSIKLLKEELQNLNNLSNNNQINNTRIITTLVNKIDENLDGIKTLRTNVQDLNNIFYSSRHRGTLGEFSLNSILSNILGENSKIWETQHKLIVDENKSTSGNVDALIRTGDGSENIAIDAKFPLDKYKEIQKIINGKESESALKISQNSFREAIKSKIKEVKKYINHKNKITNAILFVPSEAIFSYLISEMNEIFENSFKEKVWICSPTTLSAVLHVLFQVQKDYELNKNIIKVKQLIISINTEYSRFNERWIQVKKKILDNQNEIKNLDITIEKIQNQQDKLDTFKLEDENAIVN